jgi:hypothetical protein
MDEVASMWEGGMTDPGDWLRRHDWQVRTRDRATLATSYGRRLPASSTGGFVLATRQIETLSSW